VSRRIVVGLTHALIGQIERAERAVALTEGWQPRIALAVDFIREGALPRAPITP
jgi:hypothetical protein